MENMSCNKFKYFKLIPCKVKWNDSCIVLKLFFSQFE